jgi:inhibitor of KinA sporulation pathway (predicted exonuclease)
VARRKLLVVDLEATCWEKGRHQAGMMETIEIGALLVDPEHLDDVREFQSLVKPVRTSTLSDFCVQLTGIQQREVDAADEFPAVLARLRAWLGDALDARFASWGDYDKNQLQRDCIWHGLPYPLAPDHFNVKRFWTKTYRSKPTSMTTALERMGLALDGVHHRGLDDARNIWRILKAHVRGDLTGIV